MRVDRIVKAAVEALEDIKGRDIVVLNVVKLTAMFDRVIIATGDSTRQVRSLAENVQAKVREKGGAVQGMEGLQTSEWVLIDLGTVIVHVMLPTVRAHYNLEELWTARPAERKTRKRATTEVEADADTGA